jgi:hypothetical protein
VRASRNTDLSVCASLDLAQERAGEQARLRKRLFTAEETDLLGSATDEDMRAAAGTFCKQLGVNSQ